MMCVRRGGYDVNFKVYLLLLLEKECLTIFSHWGVY